MLVCRTEKPLNDSLKEKIGLFCNMDASDVIECMDADSIYEVPLVLEQQGFASKVCEHLSLNCAVPALEEWKKIVEIDKADKDTVNIGLVGKYVELHDAYLSVAESLKHAGLANNLDVNIHWIHSEDVTPLTVDEMLKDMDGILVPGGFGDRGVEGKIEATRYARENKVPFFGICLGMQVAVIEYARNVLGYKNAHSSELDPNTEYPVIDLLPEQHDIEDMGGTLRLGLYPCKIAAGSKSEEAYGESLIYERHRHRYEFNNHYRDALVEAGLIISGLSPDDRLVEIVELEDHPWFVAGQFHPEFKSRPTRSHPLFREFVKASKANER
jgi:CTP synthase